MMNRFAFLATVGTLPLLVASCSGSGNTESGAGGTATSTSGGASGVADAAGGSAAGGTGNTTISGGSPNTGGSGTGESTVRDTSATTTGGAGATGGSGGTNPNTTRPNTNASGGLTSASGGTPSTGGSKGGTGGTTGSGKGGNTGVGGSGAVGGRSGTGGRAGTGGRPAAGGTAATGGSGSGGVTTAGGATTTAGAPGSTRSVGCGKTATLKSGRASIEVPNVTDKTREYILALPTNYDPTHAYKLIFAWHPWTGSAQMIANGQYYGLQKESNNEAIFVAAEGLNFTQGAQSGLGWGNSNGQDIAFYHAMLDLFRNELCIDEERIFSTGFSFGAMFSFTLACTAESMVRAIIPMAGNTFTSGGCENGNRSVAVMAFIGLQDSLLDGHRQAVSTYARRNECATTTETMNPSWCDGLSSTNKPCTCVNHQGCKDGYPVIACEYTGGHQQAPDPGPIWDFIAQF